MEVKVLNSNRLVSLSANYNLDKQINFISNPRASYHGIDFTLDTCLSSANDTSTNKYSNFYLSNSDKYSNFLTLDNLSVNNNYDFLTYVRVSNDPTTYLAVSGSAANNSADVTFSDTLSNNSYFLLEFDFVHDTCYISNSYNVKRYLGYDYLNSKFVFLSSKDDDISLFSFLYDKSSNEIVFYKKIYDKVNYLNYDHSNDTLTFENALSTISTSPINNTSVFTIRNNYYILKETLSSSNYVYEQSLDKSKLVVDGNKSTFDYSSNFLFNNEFYSIKPYQKANLDLNLINLKNEKTVNNEQSEGGVFPSQPAFKHRYYESLFTGVNQEKGNYNIGLGYAGYSISKILKKDNLNYFHIPFDIYPYEKLNVNDSSLVVSGAIPSDTPYYSDKIFKKLADYKYSSPFGAVSNTETGAYLCTWLSGGRDINEPGLWVDRYYNPANISYYDALTESSTALLGTTDFDIISANVNMDYEKYDMYDKKSDLSFEKGALYAYHHVGNENCQTYVNLLSGNLIFNNFQRYFNNFYIKQNFTGEINFDGNYFAKALDKSLDEVSTYDNFSVSFDIYNDDWNKPFGSQIVGNYSNKGYGIFNYRRITPYSVSYDENEIYLYNTFGTLLRTIKHDRGIINITKLEPNGDFLVFDNGYNVTKYNYIGTKLDTKYLSFIDNNLTTAFYPFDKYVFILNGSDWYRLNSTSLKHNISSELSYTTKKLGDIYSSIAVKGSTVCLLSGVNPKFVDNDVYFYSGVVLQYFNINDNTLKEKVEVQILNDYTFDNNGVFYVIFDNHNLSVIDQFDTNITSSLFSLSAAPESNYVNLSVITGNHVTFGKNIDLINEWYDGKLKTDLLTIYSLSSNSLAVSGADVNLPFYTRTNTSFTNISSVVAGDVKSISTTFDTVDNINNYDYVLNNYNPGTSLDVKLRLPNIYDVQTYEEASLSYPLSNISSGYHNITTTLDTTKGLFNLFVDGNNVDTYGFQNTKYSYGTIFDNVFYIGSEASYGNNKLNENLQDVNYYNYGNFKIKNFYVYNVALYLYDVANIIRARNDIKDLYFELPTGKRNYIENVEKFFKFKLPGRKSNLFNVRILDTGITEESLQKDISNNIIEEIIQVIPANTKLNKVDWEIE
jgi:hypothetical protein